MAAVRGLYRLPGHTAVTWNGPDWVIYLVFAGIFADSLWVMFGWDPEGRGK